MSEVRILPENYFVDPNKAYSDGAVTELGITTIAAIALTKDPTVEPDGFLFNTGTADHRYSNNETMLTGPRVGFSVDEGQLVVSYWRQAADLAVIQEGSLAFRIESATLPIGLRPGQLDRLSKARRAKPLLINQSLLLAPAEEEFIEGLPVIGKPYSRITLPGSVTLQREVERNFSFEGFSTILGINSPERTLRASTPGLLDYTITWTGIEDVLLRRELTANELADGQLLFSETDELSIAKVWQERRAREQQRLHNDRFVSSIGLDHTDLAAPLKKIELHGEQGLLAGSSKRDAPVVINGKVYLISQASYVKSRNGSFVQGARSEKRFTVFDPTTGNTLKFFDGTADLIAQCGIYESSSGRPVPPRDIVDLFNLKP